MLLWSILAFFLNYTAKKPKRKTEKETFYVLTGHFSDRDDYDITRAFVKYYFVNKFIVNQYKPLEEIIDSVEIAESDPIALKTKKIFCAYYCFVRLAIEKNLFQKKIDSKVETKYSKDFLDHYNYIVLVTKTSHLNIVYNPTKTYKQNIIDSYKENETKLLETFHFIVECVYKIYNIKNDTASFKFLKSVILTGEIRFQLRSVFKACNNDDVDIRITLCNWLDFQDTGKLEKAMDLAFENALMCGITNFSIILDPFYFLFLHPLDELKFLAKNKKELLSILDNQSYTTLEELKNKPYVIKSPHKDRKLNKMIFKCDFEGSSLARILSLLSRDTDEYLARFLDHFAKVFMTINLFCNEYTFETTVYLIPEIAKDHIDFETWIPKEKKIEHKSIRSLDAKKANDTEILQKIEADRLRKNEAYVEDECETKTDSKEECAGINDTEEKCEVEAYTGDFDTETATEEEYIGESFLVEKCQIGKFTRQEDIQNLGSNTLTVTEEALSTEEFGKTCSLKLSDIGSQTICNFEKTENEHGFSENERQVEKGESADIYKKRKGENNTYRIDEEKTTGCVEILTSTVHNTKDENIIVKVPKYCTDVDLNRLSVENAAADKAIIASNVENSTSNTIQSRTDVYPTSTYTLESNKVVPRCSKPLGTKHEQHKNATECNENAYRHEETKDKNTSLYVYGYTKLVDKTKTKRHNDNTDKHEDQKDMMHRGYTDKKGNTNKHDKRTYATQCKPQNTKTTLRQPLPNIVYQTQKLQYKEQLPSQNCSQNQNYTVTNPVVGKINTKDPYTSLFLENQAAASKFAVTDDQGPIEKNVYNLPFLATVPDTGIQGNNCCIICNGDNLDGLINCDDYEIRFKTDEDFFDKTYQELQKELKFLIDEIRVGRL